MKKKRFLFCLFEAYNFGCFQNKFLKHLMLHFLKKVRIFCIVYFFNLAVRISKN